jgi:hypothetical protein
MAFQSSHLESKSCSSINKNPPHTLDNPALRPKVTMQQ